MKNIFLVILSLIVTACSTSPTTQTKNRTASSTDKVYLQEGDKITIAFRKTITMPRNETYVGLQDGDTDGKINLVFKNTSHIDRQLFKDDQFKGILKRRATLMRDKTYADIATAIEEGSVEWYLVAEFPESTNIRLIGFQANRLSFDKIDYEEFEDSLLDKEFIFHRYIQNIYSKANWFWKPTN